MSIDPLMVSQGCLCVASVFLGSLLWRTTRDVTRSMAKLSELEESSRKFSLLEPLYCMDTLTGLRTGRVFTDALAHALRNGAVALLLIELDDFERYNRINYKQGGDEALRKSACTIRSALRRRADHDSVYRPDSNRESFAVLLRGVGVDTAAAIAQQIGSMLCSIGQSASIGVCIVASHDKCSHQELLDAADGERRRAKSSGRNRVCIAAWQHLGAKPEAGKQICAPRSVVVDHNQRIQTGPRALRALG